MFSVHSYTSIAGDEYVCIFLWLFIIQMIFITIFWFFCRRYGTKCSGCAQGISPQDMVRKARDKVFHLTCFTCTICRRQLSTGEELYVLDDSKFICKDDYIQAKQGMCAYKNNLYDPLSHFLLFLLKIIWCARFGKKAWTYFTTIELVACHIIIICLDLKKSKQWAYVVHDDDHDQAEK